MSNEPYFKFWLTEADKDFHYASWSLDNAEEDFYSLILFHFQQAAEKYLKAFIVYKNLPFQKIHDLPELINLIKPIDDNFTEIEEEALYLNDFYVDTRYPVHWPIGHDKKLCLKAQKKVEKIGSLVRERMKA